GAHPPGEDDSRSAPCGHGTGAPPDGQNTEDQEEPRPAWESPGGRRRGDGHAPDEEAERGPPRAPPRARGPAPPGPRQPAPEEEADARHEQPAARDRQPPRAAELPEGPRGARFR